MFVVKEVSGNPNYADEIFEIENECFGFDAWSREAIKSALVNNNYLFLVCIENAKAVGYVNASFVLEEAELNRIAVLKNCRGKGVGKLLADVLLKELKNRDISLVRLEVRASNLPAISLYESKKFQKYAVRKKYYNNPDEDAIMMSLII